MSIEKDVQPFAQRSATVFHPISVADKTAMDTLRAIVEPKKGSLRGTAARAPFDAIMDTSLFLKACLLKPAAWAVFRGGGRGSS
ncbi:MAG: hypothetical protein JO340_03555 [Acidobacteriaceae bacterium]|nr:hypothetical protein [Acidobacteriaceae bacterium]